MKRRTALKAMAAALLTPLVRLRTEINREALMMPFCLPYESLKYDLQQPFQQGSLTYATDTYRMIRAELTGPEITGERRLPPAGKVWNEHWNPVEWFEFQRPAITDLVSRDDGLDGTCPVCLDRMVSFGEHYPSREILEDLCRRGVRWDVDDNTHGDESCPQCHGKAYYGPSLARISDKLLSFDKLAPIWNLPCPVRFALNKDPRGPVLFTADGFEGLVMPMNLTEVQT
jgi:hypothetical protein